MSIEQNIDPRQLTSHMDIPANNQLVPYYPLQNPVIPHTPKSSPTLSLSDEPKSRRYVLSLPSVFTEHQNNPDLPDSAYNSSRCIAAPKINQVGLLIDIYA